MSTLRSLALFISSECILFIEFIICVCQACSAQYGQEKERKRLRHILLVVFTIFWFLILNTMAYLPDLMKHSVISINFQSDAMYTTFELVAVVFGILAFHRLAVSQGTILLAKLPDGADRATKWVSRITKLQLLHWFAVITCIICHVLSIVFNQMQWIYVFFLFLNTMVFVTGIKLLSLINKAWESVESCHWILIGLTVGGLCIGSIVECVFVIESMIGSESPGVDFIMMNLNTSIMLIYLAATLVVWIYRDGLCTCHEQTFFSLLFGYNFGSSSPRPLDYPLTDTVTHLSSSRNVNLSLGAEKNVLLIGGSQHNLFTVEESKSIRSATSAITDIQR